MPGPALPALLGREPSTLVNVMNNNRGLNIAVTAIVAAIVALVSVKLIGGASGSTGPGTARKNTIATVFSSGVIRCGYVPYPPGLIKDPNSGKISGIFPEILEQAALNLGLKVEWTEEVGWGTMVEGLTSGRYDMVGSPVWPTSQRARVADFTQPLYFGGVEAYVRADDNRFDTSLATINDPQIKIATTDGEVTELIAQQDFPKAKRVSLPQLTDLSQLLLTVADGKADVTFAEPHTAYAFIKNNPGKLKSASPGRPVRTSANTMMLRQDDEAFRRMVDLAIAELESNGFVDQVLLKYEPYPGAFYRNASPIRSPERK